MAGFSDSLTATAKILEASMTAAYLEEAIHR
jgi:hypothetical protein